MANEELAGHNRALVEQNQNLKQEILLAAEGLVCGGGLVVTKSRLGGAEDGADVKVVGVDGRGDKETKNPSPELAVDGDAGWRRVDWQAESGECIDDRIGSSVQGGTQVCEMRRELSSLREEVAQMRRRESELQELSTVQQTLLQKLACVSKSGVGGVGRRTADTEAAKEHESRLPLLGVANPTPDTRAQESEQ